MSLRWKGADRGREQFLHKDAWLKVLEILGDHEGESHRDLDSPVFDALTSEFPEVAWIGGKHGDRSFFRDYPTAWTTPQVIRPFAETGGVIELTPQGRELVRDEISVSEFFRSHLDRYVESHDLHGSEYLLWPFAYISAILCAQSPIPITDLQHAAEELASYEADSPDGSLFPKNDDLNDRRFRTYLILLENANAIQRDGPAVTAVDHDYLSDMSSGIEAPEIESGNVDVDSLLEDNRTVVYAKAIRRERQQAFRAEVMTAYAHVCCVSANTESSILEGAHILPYRGRQSNDVTNGLLLAVDIHRLFDQHLLGIDPEGHKIRLSPMVIEERYTNLEGTDIALPSDKSNWPDPDALGYRFEQFSRLWPD